MKKIVMIECLVERVGNISHSQNLKNDVLQAWENIYKYKEIMSANKSKYDSH